MTEIKKLPKSKIGFEVAVAWEKWKGFIDQAVKEISEEIKIQGFRPGKAPRNLVEQKVGKEAILNNASEKAVQKSYLDFVLSEKLETIGSPKVEIKEIKEGGGLKYAVQVAVMPEVKVKSDYKKSIQKINEDFSKKPNEVKDDEVELELEKLANSRVKLVTVLREARKNDNVEIDFTALQNGVPIENGTSKKHNLILGRGVFIPGFEENLIGMKGGEEKEFELSFPGEYHNKNLAGKPATFKVKLNLVQERQTPEMTDEFAKSLGNFENLEALKKNIREGLLHEQEHKAKDEKRIQYLDSIAKNSEIDLPEVLVQEEIKIMLGEFEQQIQSMGMNIDDYLSKIKKDKKELAKDWEGQAQKRVVSALALKEIAKEETIEAKSDEIEAEINKVLQYYKNVKDLEKNIDMERLYNYSKSNLENEKVFEYLEKL